MNSKTHTITLGCETASLVEAALAITGKVNITKENQIMGDLASPAPTNFSLEAVETTTAYSISDEDIKKLIKE